MRTAKQLKLALPQRGGYRKGAGRKPKGPRALVSHKPRPRFARPMPNHVTLRVRREVWNLRSARSWRRLRAAFAASCGRFGLRLIQFSIQGNHIHMIVEADSHESLSRGMQGLCVRIAKALNAMMKRKGPVFADHYHSSLLETPTKLVNAIRYVLNNHQHHFGAAGIDPYNSAGLPEADREILLALPRGWLLRVGWRRARFTERNGISGSMDPPALAG